MFESNTFALPLDQFAEAGKSLLIAAQYIPPPFSLSSLVIATAGLAIAASLVTIIFPIALACSVPRPFAGELDQCSSTSNSNTFILPLDQFTEAGKSLLIAAQKNPSAFGLTNVVIVASGVSIVAGIVIIIVPIAIGFSVTGPVAGTIAAAWQAWIGNVVAGSWFAILQSLTMSGTLMTVGGGLIAVGVLGLAVAVDWSRTLEWAKGVDWSDRKNWAGWTEMAGLADGMMEQWMRDMGREGWRITEGVRNVDWQRVADNVEWTGRELWKRTEEGVRNGDWEGITERAVRGAWRRTEERVKGMDWEGVAQGAERARKETWKKAAEGIRGVGWEGMAEGAEWIGEEAWRRTEEGVRGVDWEGVAQGAARAGKETWKKAEEGIRGVDWEGVAQGAERAGKETWKKAEEGIRGVDWEGMAEGAEWIGKEAWRRTEEGVRGVDWEGVAKSAERARKETWKKAEEGIRGVDWEGMGQGVQRALAWW